MSAGQETVQRVVEIKKPLCGVHQCFVPAHVFSYVHGRLEIPLCKHHWDVAASGYGKILRAHDELATYLNAAAPDPGKYRPIGKPLEAGE